MLKGEFHQVGIGILNTCVPNNRAKNYVKQKLIEMKGEMEKSAIIALDFNTISQQLRERLERKSTKILKNSTIPSSNRIELAFVDYFPQQW
jgi:hypothetical protein